MNAIDQCANTIVKRAEKQARAVAELFKKRGGLAELGRLSGVDRATVARWRDGKKLRPTMRARIEAAVATLADRADESSVP